MKVFKCRFIILVVLLISLNFQSLYSQIGNSNGQYTEVIKQAFSILHLLNNGDKKVLQEKFTETNFQSKKEYNKILSTSNIKWIKKIIETSGNPNDSDIVIAGWKTVAKENHESNFSINITFYFKGQNHKYSNSDDHICFNFYKKPTGDYIFNGLMFFKKSDYLSVKKVSYNSK